MRTEKSIQAGGLLLVLRSDGGVYVGRPEPASYGPAYMPDPLRIGSSAAICDELAQALTEMAAHIREGHKQRDTGGQGS
jgi:hypothetical protein